MAGDMVSEDISVLFEKHGALFIDKEDDDAVFARIQAGRDEATVYASFNKFYNNVVVCDLTNQWICQDGAFRYDATWLSSSASKADIKKYLQGQFNLVFGLDPEVVQLISP